MLIDVPMEFYQLRRSPRGGRLEPVANSLAVQRRVSDPNPPVVSGRYRATQSGIGRVLPEDFWYLVSVSPSQCAQVFHAFGPNVPPKLPRSIILPSSGLHRNGSTVEAFRMEPERFLHPRELD